MSDPIDERLITTFGRLVEAYSRLQQHVIPIIEKKGGLPYTWFEAMLRLRRSPDGQMTMGALAEQIALTTGGITRLVDRLEKAGYVERRPCPTDRRVSFAALTQSGRETLDHAAAEHARDLRELFAEFTDEELTSLDTQLDRLRNLADRSLS